MDVKKCVYYLDFAPCPLLAIGLSIGTLHASAPAESLAFAETVLAALITWPALEYLVHRLVYHHVPIIRDLHDVHHRNPASYESGPPFLGCFSIALFVSAPLMPFGSILASGTTVGTLIGYSVYTVVHHALHHWSIAPKSVLYAAWRRHARHHYSRTPGNYGVTSNLLDRVFGTALH